MKRSHSAVLGSLVLVAVCSGVPVHARQAPDQARGGVGQRVGRPPVVTALELERWFDSYVLLQAQEALKLSDAQFPRFITRLKALQDVRRRNLQERRQLLQALGKLLRASPVDEAQAKETLKALSDLEARSPEEVRKAHQSLDEVLDPLQQARFRLLEENVERKKLELLVRARQAAAEGERNQPPVPR